MRKDLPISSWVRQLRQGLRNLARHLFGVLARMVVSFVVLIMSADAVVSSPVSTVYRCCRRCLRCTATWGGPAHPVALVRPLILHYGGGDVDDMYGLARLATDAEARGLTGDTDLLIDRDRGRGELLLFPGPSYLLTIPPTCSGKGIGTIIPNLFDYPFAVVCRKGSPRGPRP